MGPVQLQAGPYNVTFGPQNDLIQILVPDDTNVYSLWNLWTNATSLTNFPVLPGISTINGVGGVQVIQNGSAYIISGSNLPFAAYITNILGNYSGATFSTNFFGTIALSNAYNTNIVTNFNVGSVRIFGGVTALSYNGNYPTYYVSSNGSITNTGITTNDPWPSLSYAISAAIPHSTVLIDASIVWTNGINNTPFLVTNPLTISSYNGQALIFSTNWNTASGNIQVAASGVTISNLAFASITNAVTNQVTGGRFGNGIYIGLGASTGTISNLTICNCVFSNLETWVTAIATNTSSGFGTGGGGLNWQFLNLSGNGGSSGFAGIELTPIFQSLSYFPFTNVLISGCEIANILGHSNELSGIGAACVSVRGLTIISNSFHDLAQSTSNFLAGSGGAVWTMCDTGYVTYNTAYRIHCVQDTRIDGVGIDCDYTNWNFLIEHNLSYDNQGPGGYIFAGCSNITWRWNISFNNAQGYIGGVSPAFLTTEMLLGVGSTGMTNINIYSNIFIGLGTNTEALNTTTAATLFGNCAFSNNQFITLSGETLVMYATNTTLLGNNYYRIDQFGPNFLYNSVPYAGVFAFTNGTLQDASGQALSVNPFGQWTSFPDTVNLAFLLQRTTTNFIAPSFGAAHVVTNNDTTTIGMNGFWKFSGTDNHILSSTGSFAWQTTDWNGFTGGELIVVPTVFTGQPTFAFEGVTGNPSGSGDSTNIVFDSSVIINAALLNSINAMEVGGKNIYSLLPGANVSFSTNVNLLTISSAIGALNIATNNLNSAITNFNVSSATFSNLFAFTNASLATLVQASGVSVTNAFQTNGQFVISNGIVVAGITNGNVFGLIMSGSNFYFNGANALSAGLIWSNGANGQMVLVPSPSGGGGASQSPWTGVINGNFMSLTNVTNITIGTTTTSSSNVIGSNYIAQYSNSIVVASLSNGVFQGNGGLLTNLSAAQLQGQVPLVSLTNIQYWLTNTLAATEGSVPQYHNGIIQWINTNLFGGSGGQNQSPLLGVINGNGFGFTNVTNVSVGTSGISSSNVIGSNYWAQWSNGIVIASQSNGVFQGNAGSLTNIIASTLIGTVPSASLQFASNNLNLVLTNLTSIQILTNNLNTAVTNNDVNALIFSNSLTFSNNSVAKLVQVSGVSVTNISDTNGDYVWLAGVAVSGFTNANVFGNGSLLTALTAANISGTIPAALLQFGTNNLNLALTNMDVNASSFSNSLIFSNNIVSGLLQIAGISATNFHTTNASYILSNGIAASGMSNGTVYALASLLLQGSNIYTLLPGANVTFTTNGNEMTIAATGGGGALNIATNNLNTALTNFDVNVRSISNVWTWSNNAAAILLQLAGNATTNIFQTNGWFVLSNGVINASVSNGVFFGVGSGLTNLNLTNATVGTPSWVWETDASGYTVLTNVLNIALSGNGFSLTNLNVTNGYGLTLSGAANGTAILMVSSVAITNSDVTSRSMSNTWTWTNGQVQFAGPGVTNVEGSNYLELVKAGLVMLSLTNDSLIGDANSAGSMSNMVASNMTSSIGFFGNGTNLQGIVTTNGAQLNYEPYYSGTGTGVNGISWAPATNVDIVTTSIRTNFINGQLYTNLTGSLILLIGSTTNVDGGVISTGANTFTIAVSNTGYSSWSNYNTGGNVVATSIAGLLETNTFNIPVDTNGVYMLSTTASGSGNSSGLIPGTGQIVTIGNATASGVASLGGNNIFTGNNTFTGATVLKSFTTTNITIANGTKFTFTIAHGLGYVPTNFISLILVCTAPDSNSGLTAGISQTCPGNVIVSATGQSPFTISEDAVNLYINYTGTAASSCNITGPANGGGTVSGSSFNNFVLRATVQ